MIEKNNISQAELVQKVRPLFEKEGEIYHKFRNILARQAAGGERIDSITGDGLETTKVAKEGDFIVQNQTKAGEQYIVSPQKFAEKYQHIGPVENDFHEYKPLGKITALELTAERLKALDLPEEFHFMAAWDEAMVAKEGDFLATDPKIQEVYRIARAEFFETYKK